MGEKVLVLAKRLKKKRMQLGFYSKVQLKIFLFLIKMTFIVRRVLPIRGNFYYWLSKSGEDKRIDKRFLRQELFALKNQFTNNN